MRRNYYSYMIAILATLISGSLMLQAESDPRVAHFAGQHHVLESADDLDPLLERIGEARIVLLGEASHGTSEYYRWRAKISRRLIEEKGFDIVLVEGDWPSCYAVDRTIKGLPGAAADVREALGRFQRWPQWMWANEEVLEFAEWLLSFNRRQEERRAGFYGMDIYAMPESLDAVIAYSRESLPEHIEKIEAHYAGLLRFRSDPQVYARYTAQMSRNYAGETSAVLALLRAHRETLKGQDADAFFNAEQNALAVKNGEKHYRAMADPRMNSWNKRVVHMKMTLRRLLESHGTDSRIIVWAHNTHIGDARATAMARQGMQNIGQLTREHFGREQVVAVGFGTYTGTVLAGSHWGAPVEEMQVPPALEHSLEELMNRVGQERFLIVFDEAEIPPPLLRPLGHRAKGVVYNPRNEAGNYVPTVLPQRYDAFIFIRTTSALTILE